MMLKIQLLAGGNDKTVVQNANSAFESLKNALEGAELDWQETKEHSRGSRYSHQIWMKTTSSIASIKEASAGIQVSMEIADMSGKNLSHLLER